MRRLLVLVLLLACFPFAESQRTRYNFNPGWLLKVGDDSAAAQPRFDDSGWKRVTLPHAWNEDFAYKVAIYNLPTGIAWYRKHFIVPSTPKEGRVFIEFQGARLAAQVYLNGHFLGLSENGVMAFGSTSRHT